MLRVGELDPGLHGNGWRKSSALAFGGGPMGFDFDQAFDSGGVVAEARPLPIFGLRDQTAPDGIAMHIAELLGVLGFGVDVEVIVAALPEVNFAAPLEFP